MSVEKMVNEIGKLFVKAWPGYVTLTREVMDGFSDGVARLIREECAAGEGEWVSVAHGRPKDGRDVLTITRDGKYEVRSRHYFNPGVTAYWRELPKFAFATPQAQPQEEASK